MNGQRRAVKQEKGMTFNQKNIHFSLNTCAIHSVFLPDYM